MTADRPPPDAPDTQRGPLERLLSVFAEVRQGEGGTALLLALNVFLLLMCYYLIRPVREALILQVPSGAEIKSYLSAGQVFLLLFLIPAYSAFANRVDRIRLITGVTLIFIACLVVFYGLAQLQLTYLGVAFFLWIGIFNVMITAQFWAYANDVYTEEQGKRLFAIVAFGATLGAVFGSGIAAALIRPFGLNQLMLVSAGVLGVSLALTRIIDARLGAIAAATRATRATQEPMSSTGGFQLVLRDRYLLYIGLLVLAINLVNSNGEYILGKTLSMLADRNIAAGVHGALDPGEYKRQFIGGFYATFLVWVSVVTALVQLFLVSRVIKWFGVRVALFVMPLVALGGYAMLAITPILGLIRTVKVLENSLDYSLQNTARHALWLPTSRDAKYKAKAATDTFFWRAGDVLSALIVFIGAQIGLHPQSFAAINVVLVLGWLAVLVALARRHRALAEVRAADAAR